MHFCCAVKVYGMVRLGEITYFRITYLRKRQIGTDKSRGEIICDRRLTKHFYNVSND